MTRSWRTLVVLAFLVMACASEQEPATNAQAEHGETHEPASSEPEASASMAAADPAAQGLPEVRYYTLGGA